MVDNAVCSASFSVEPGEFISLIGPNGSGKSTLLKLICGIYKPGTGEVLINNLNIAGLKRKDIARRISFVPQTLYTAFPYSVSEIVMMGRTPYLNLFGFENAGDREIVENAMEMADIIHLRDKGISEVSGGEAQRAFIARALAQQTDLILLDEPNSHLDMKHQIAVFKLLSKLNSELNKTIICISHDLNLAANYSKRVILLNKGKIFTDGSVDEVLNREIIEEIFEVQSEVVRNDNDSVNVIFRHNR